MRTPNFFPRTAEVIQIDEQLKFDGNIIPREWVHRIITKAGHADMIACMVLAEIVYWYRGVEGIVEGKPAGRKRKFESDYLQKSYADLAEKLNLSKGQVTAAVVRLEELSLIKREFRTLTIRGVRTSNVLFIRLFAYEVIKISEASAGSVALPVGQSSSVGCGENSGYLSERSEGACSPSAGTSTGAAVDKYTEHSKDFSPDYSPGKETTTAAESAEPTPTSLSFISNENTPTSHATTSGSVQSSSPANLHSEHPASAPSRPAAVKFSASDVRSIRPVLEQAFGGQKFSARDEAALQSYIVEGRITCDWAHGFSMAKALFDRNRGGYKAQDVFLPYKPGFLIRNFDRTEQGILSVLGDQHSDLQNADYTYDGDDLKPFLKALARYDDYFTKYSYFNQEYRDAIRRVESVTEFDRVFVEPHRFIHHNEGDAVPPAWMRLMFAFRKGVCNDYLRTKLLAQAQQELGRDPGCAKLLPEPISDEEFRAIFDLEYPTLLQTWEREHEQRNQLMEELQNLIAAILDNAAEFVV